MLGWLCRMKKARSRAGYAMQPTLPDLPQAPPRSEAAKEAEAEQTAKHLKQQLPVGPKYLTRDDLVEAVKPSDAQMALCSLYCNRCAKRLPYWLCSLCRTQRQIRAVSECHT